MTDAPNEPPARPPDEPAPDQPPPAEPTRGQPGAGPPLPPEQPTEARPQPDQQPPGQQPSGYEHAGQEPGHPGEQPPPLDYPTHEPPPFPPDRGPGYPGQGPPPGQGPAYPGQAAPPPGYPTPGQPPPFQPGQGPPPAMGPPPGQGPPQGQGPPGYPGQGPPPGYQAQAQYGPPIYPEAIPPPQRKKRPVTLIVLGILGAALLLCACGIVALVVAVNHDNKPDRSANGGLSAPSVSAQPSGSATAAPSSGAPGSFGEGTFAVGTDIPAGTYEAAVPDDSLGCYWEISKDDTGNIDSIIANATLKPGAHGLVQVAGGQFLKTTGCGRWSPATKPATPSKQMSEGTFRVGVDIAAGTYTTDVPADSDACYWAISKDGSGTLDSVTSNDILDAGAHGRVSLNAGQWFDTTGCGTWKQ